MRMLGRRLALCCYLDCLPRFRCRRTITGLRSIHLSPNYGGTEALTQPAEHPVPPPAAGPGWVTLSRWVRRGDSDTVPDANTVAESRTSTGRAFRVSANLAAPPASSFLIFHDREGSSAAGGGVEDRDDDGGTDPDDDDGGSTDPGDDGGGRVPGVVAAHGDSVLFQIEHRLGICTSTYDYFVYRSGAAGRPPSLSLLPTHDLSKKPGGGLKPQHPREQTLSDRTTGLLRRSEDELLVVDLEQQRSAGKKEADLHVLRLGSSEWEKKEAVPIVLNDGSRDDDETLFDQRGIIRWPDGIVPVGDRFLCWVSYSGGILVCDMAADPNLMLRFSPLPVLPREGRHGGGRYVYEEDEDWEMEQCRNMCAAGAGAVRLVSIDPRCCCGGPGRGTCPRCSFAFTVTTWTMSLTTMDEKMIWVKDGVMDCEELWALPGYEGLPRVPPDSPVVSPENPDVVCFQVNEGYRKVWMLRVDTRRKALLSVLCSEDTYNHLPAKLG